LRAGDNYPKVIITNQPDPPKDLKGIKVMNIIDFLLEDHETA
jgi:hypothetical protein